MRKRALPMTCAGIAVSLLLPACAVAAGPTPAAEYDGLMGEGLAGSGFVIRHRGALLGVCSLHQFDGSAPGEFIPFDGGPVALDAAYQVKQDDVQVLPVRSAAADLPFLDYQPDFQLKAGDAVLLLDPGGGVVSGTLTSTGMRSRTYSSSDGPATLSIRTDQPFAAAGCSGGPVILRSSGAVIGVLLTADDPRAARTVGFETLCLDPDGPLSVRAKKRFDAGDLFCGGVFLAIVALPIGLALRSRYAHKARQAA